MMLRCRPLKSRIRSCFTPIRCYHNASIAPDGPIFRISPEVRSALTRNQPVVALETTIYTHGFPHPENLSLARELEGIVRSHGGVPAHIGVLAGVARVGLAAGEIAALVAPTGAGPRKLSRRDLAAALCQQQQQQQGINGGTTIAGTMVLAHLAGIRVFATGGLGGVHRGGGWDVSADLTELGRTPVAVVSGGCKGFLDVAATLEYLETQGVGVLTFADGGSKVDYPAFWSRESGCPSPGVVRDEEEAARIIHAQFSLPLHSGIHFASPIPLAAAIPKREMDDVIARAIHAAEVEGAVGKDNTPFILSKINELTNGRSISANRALIASSVKRGTLMAKELAKIQLQGYHHFLGNGSYSVKFPITESPEAGPYQQNLPVDILVAGALAVDCSCDFSPGAASSNKSPLLHTSNPAIIRHSLGGVGHNVAKAAHYLGKNVRLCSIVADDLAGMMARQGLQKDGMDVDDIIASDSSSESSTAQYVAVNDVGKDLVLAMADMAILESTDTKTLQKWSTTIQRTKPSWVMADANWHPSLLRFWLEEGKKSGASTAYEPVSTAKSSRVFSSTPAAGFPDFAPLPVFPGHLVDLASPNFMELQSMSEAARSCGHFERQEWWETIDALGIPSSGITHRLEALTSNELVVQGVPQQTIQMLPYMPTILTKMGSKGVLLTKLLRKNDAQLSDPKASRYIASRSPDAPNSSVGGLYMRWFPPPAVLESTEIVSVNGAGDTFLGAILSALTRPDCPAVEDVVDFAQAQAARSLKSRETVSPDLKSVGVLKSQDCTYEA